MRAVPVKSAAEALFIAVEMEKRAVKLYERAALAFPENAASPALHGLLAEERQHLASFSALLGNASLPQAEALLLSAYAAGILFEGGLHAAARNGAFDSPEALLHYAAQQERIAIDCYAQFAAACASFPDASRAFGVIAQEERRHLSTLEKALGA